MARDSHMRERIFFTHSDPHGAAPSHGKFLTGIPDDDLLQRPSLHEKEEVEKFLLAVVARFKAFKMRVPTKTCGGKRPQRASASKAKSSVLSQLSGLENVFIDDELDSEDLSKHRASASLPDSVPIESEEEVLHVKQMRWLRSMLSGIMRQTQMCVCVCVCVRATSICVRENLHLHFLIFVCVCACNREGTSHTSSRVDGTPGWSDKGL
jgi:hypothetical protein